MNRQQQELFDRRKKLSVYWYNKASDLFGSAGALWENMHAADATTRAEKLGLGSGFSFEIACRPPYEMLCGMALELLFKAIIVGKRKEPKPIHNLVLLSEDASLSYSEKQRGLLRVLSEAIIWGGRYPVPKREEQFQEASEARREHLFDKVPLGKLYVFQSNRSLSWESFTELWNIAFAVYAEDHF